MKILLLNGSPKKEDSRTLELVGSFLEGLDDNPNYPEIELMKIHMIDMNIGDCMGCFHCWDDPNVPKCIYRDDMDILLPLYVEVDLVIWSFPIYYFALPSNIIRFQQRMLPIMDSSIVEVEDNRFIHPLRNSEVLDRYEIFFSTGGLPSFENNFESLEMYVTLLKGEKGQKIFLPQSESIHKPYMEKKASRLKKLIYESGKSFHLDTGIDKKWLQKLSKPLMEPDYYTKIANQYLVK